MKNKSGTTYLMHLNIFLLSYRKEDWLRFCDIVINFRKNQRKFKGDIYKTLDIVHAIADKKSCGAWTRFVDELSSCYQLLDYGFEYIYVETVLTERFADWFRKNNWEQIGQGESSPCFCIAVKDFYKESLSDI